MSAAVKALVAAMTAVALVGAACSSAPEQDTSQRDGTRAGQKDGKEKGKRGADKTAGANKNDNGPGGKKGSRPGGDAAPGSGADQPSPPPVAGGGSDAPAGSFASDGPPSPVDPSLARRSASVEDSPSDAQKEGVTPAYGELLGVKVQGLGEQFEMRLTFGGTVPEKTESKNTQMMIGFGISAGGNDTYGFTAQATPEGWKAYAGAKHQARRFPGQFLVEGDTIVMRVPWSFINGPRKFRFQATTTWFRTIGQTTHYVFDMAPDKQSAQFPG